jgi:hypothetical protein
MPRKPRTTIALLASAALATASLFVSAPAQATDQRCFIAVSQWCSAHWEAAGYLYWWDCVSTLNEGICYYPNYGDPNWPYLPPVP